MKKIFTLILGICITLHSFSQKAEKKSSIKLKDVPKSAIYFIKYAVKSETIKWFYEENELSNSFEARFKTKNKNTSVEFNIDGTIKNIEVEISKSKIPSKTRKKIDKYLSIYFSEYKLEKIQKQFIGDSNSLMDQFKNKSIVKKKPSLYKIIAIGKSKDELKLMEFLFDSSGFLIGSNTFLEKNSYELTY